MTYISDINVSTPTGGSSAGAGDDQIRTLKTDIYNSFPNVSGAVTATHTELNVLDGITVDTDRLNDIPIPDGTTMLFYKDVAPTGWTRIDTLTNHALRLVGSSGGGTGAADNATRTNFSSIFANTRTTDGGTGHSHTITVATHELTEAELPSHQHTVHIPVKNEAAYLVDGSEAFGGTQVNAPGADNAVSGNRRAYTSNVGSGTAHGHTGSTASSESSHTHDIDLNIKYVNVIMCTKDAV